MSECDPAAVQKWESRLGPAGLRRVLSTMVADAPRLLGLLRDSVVRNDAQALAFAAHALKAPCGMFGSAGLADLCQELEELGAGGTLAGVQVKAEMLAARFELLVTELQSLS